MCVGLNTVILREVSDEGEDYITTEILLLILR
jgi:hypothetical protein